MSHFAFERRVIIDGTIKWTPANLPKVITVEDKDLTFNFGTMHGASWTIENRKMLILQTLLVRPSMLIFTNKTGRELAVQ